MKIRVTLKQAERYVAAMNKHYGDKTAAGAEFGLSPKAFSLRLAIAEGKHGLKPANFTLLEQRAKLRATPEQAKTVNALKAMQDAAYMRSQIKQLNEDLDRANQEIDRYKFATKAGVEPAEWTMKTRVGHKSDHMPVLFVSDAQVGEVIDGAEVEYGRGYNTMIFRERYRELVETFIYLSTKHVGSDWRFPGMIYIRGGDAISGGIHEELRDTDDATPLEAVQVVFEEEAAGILKLADAFGKVEVKSVSGGNHDRTTMKPRGKNRTGHSYDALIDFMLAHHFRDDKRVTFQLTKSTDVIFPIFDKQVLATHGDNIGGGGGTGFIGPQASILKGVSKIMMEQTNMGRIIDHVYVGHFHSFGHTRRHTSNGCFPGLSEFARKFRMTPEPPMQVAQYWSASRGLVDIKPIVLK